MKKKLSLLVLLAIALCMGCYDDKGNYDYHEFNEISIGDRGFDTAISSRRSWTRFGFHPKSISSWRKTRI